MKKIKWNFKTWLSLFGLVSLQLCLGPLRASAGQLDPSNWTIYNYSGAFAPYLGAPLPPTGLHVQNTTPAPLPAPNQLTNLTDGNLSSYATLTNSAILLVDLGQTNVLDRVYFIGSMKPSNMWYNYSSYSATPPLGLITVYVGNTTTNTNLVASYTVPYDAGNPVETEADLRFSPAAGRYVRLELHNQVTWGFNYWPGYAISPQPPSTNVNWNVGELEFYGFSGAAATQTNVNAVVLPGGAAAPLALAASELSYYLGELTGLPHPIIPPASTNQYSGNLYEIVDLASLAPNYATMMSNIGNGLLPTNINATISGNVIQFASWPYRAVLWSVWQFLESQGVRWVYPDSHGDYVPTNGLNLSVLPFQYTPPTFSIYANFDVSPFEPWPSYQLQSIRQENLYIWRNHWTVSAGGGGVLGGTEIPYEPAPSVTVNSNFTEGFLGYPHNITSVIPTRILDMTPYTNWWGWASTNPGSAVDPSTEGSASPTPYANPVCELDNPSLISWVAQKMTNIAAAYPPGSTHPLNINHTLRPFNILPLDASVYSQDPYTIASNGPPLLDPIPFVKEYGNSYSGMYYSLITSVANEVQQLSPSSVPLVGALGYADVFLPPTNIPALTTFPTNVQVEFCYYGAPNLPMTSLPNAAMKAAGDGWHSACSHLATYDYALLHTDFEQPNPLMPVALVAGTLSRSQYAASIGAADGGCQANLASLPHNPWNFYAYPRTRWNTNQTAAQIEQEFFTGYFQEAAAPMLAYYQAMENYQVTNGVNLYYGGYCYGMTPGSFPVNVLGQMQTNLLAAEQLATNWWVAARLKTMGAGFNWLISNSPDGLVGVNLTNTSLFRNLNPTTGVPININLTNMTPTPPQSMPFGNNNSFSPGPPSSWSILSPGSIQETLNIPAGTYVVSIPANAVEQLGTWPVMNVFLGPQSSSATITNAYPNFINYNFTFTIPAGVFDLVIAMPNNYLGYFYVENFTITLQ